MKYQLVLQWPAESTDDYDRMIAIETQIEDHLPEEDGYVDGHDAGSGEVNIFVHTNSPQRTFDRIRPILVDENALDDVRVAYRPITGDDYTILWPKDLKAFDVS